MLTFADEYSQQIIMFAWSEWTRAIGSTDFSGPKWSEFLIFAYLLDADSPFPLNRFLVWDEDTKLAQLRHSRIYSASGLHWRLPKNMGYTTVLVDLRLDDWSWNAWILLHIQNSWVGSFTIKFDWIRWVYYSNWQTEREWPLSLRSEPTWDI